MILHYQTSTNNFAKKKTTNNCLVKLYKSFTYTTHIIQIFFYFYYQYLLKKKITHSLLNILMFFLEKNSQLPSQFVLPGLCGNGGTW